MKIRLILAALALTLAAHAQTETPPAVQESFALTSASMTPGERLKMEQVYNDWGAGGENRSPQISWSNAPQGTKSFAITMYDPDAPTGSGWWHWVVFNLPATTISLPESASGTEQMPAGAMESLTDYGKPGYGGACPPVGAPAHRYILTVWALDVEKLELTAQTPAAQVGYYLNQHALAKASIESLYSR